MFVITPVKFTGPFHSDFCGNWVILFGNSVYLGLFGQIFHICTYLLYISSIFWFFQDFISLLIFAFIFKKKIFNFWFDGLRLVLSPSRSWRSLPKKNWIWYHISGTWADYLDYLVRIPLLTPTWERSRTISRQAAGFLELPGCDSTGTRG